jgi:hypothetical protein
MLPTGDAIASAAQNAVASDPAARTGVIHEMASAIAERGRRYLLISPCRDEAKHMRRTLDSVAAQTELPALWIVVDDGSTDGTSEILEAYKTKLPFLRVVTRRDRGARKVGPGVIDAFYAGLETVRLDDYDFVCKLDMDLDLPARYFELMMDRMAENPRIGTTSGKPWFTHPQSGALLPEVCGDEMSVGATKFYRVACFKEIGGFVREVMWDGIDCHRCRMLGWIAESRDVEAIRYLHLRPMASSEKNVLVGRKREGYGQYFMGTSPLYILARTVYRLPTYPFVVGALVTLWSYCTNAFRGAPRYEDEACRRFIRQYQIDCLRHGKAKATRMYDERQAPVWHAAHPDPAASN